MRWPAARRIALATSAAHPERIPAEDARRLVRAYATAPGFAAANTAMRAGRFTALDQIRVPATLAGPSSTGSWPCRGLCRPGVRSVPLPGCGHLPTWDDPDAVARVLLEGSAV